MAYEKQNFAPGQTLTAAQLNHIEEGVHALDTGKLDASALPEAVNSALAQAKASGEFDGPVGPEGPVGPVGPAGPAGSDASVTQASVRNALGYTPADAAAVEQITDYVHITPGTDGEKAENIRNDANVTWTDGLYVNYKTGATSTHASYTGSEHYFILPEGGRVFARFKNDNLYYPTVAFYNGSRAFLGGEYPVLTSTDERDEYNGMYGYFYNIPTGSKYFRVSFGINAKANLEIYLVSPTKVGGSVSIPDLHIPRSAIDGKKVVCFGDSLFGMYRGEDSAPAFVAKETGATAYNVGFGGCRMSVHPTSGYAAFSMWALAKAIAENDWSTQDAQASAGSAYFPEQLTLLKSIDFGSVDIVVIHYGTNDFGAGTAVQIDNAADPDDYNTLCGALRYSVEKLLSAYPKLRIYVSLPVYRYWTASDGGVTYAETYLNKGGKTLPEFVEALRSTAAEYNLPVIDGYYGLGINKANAPTFLEDGTHHNATGRERFGRYIGANLVSQQTSGKSGVDMTAVQALINNAIGAAIGGAY